LIVRRELLLPFIGNRSYLHGTTLLQALLPFATDFCAFSFRIPSPLLVNRLFLETGDENRSPPATSCQLVWMDYRGARKWISVSTGSTSVLGNRVPYPEEEIVMGWSQVKSEASLKTPSGATVFEALIALNKTFLSAFAPLSDDEQFLATRVDLKSPIPSDATIRIRHVKLVGGRHHICKVFLDDVDSGMIYFARQKRIAAI
jgi:hypothetical protein